MRIVLTIIFISSVIFTAYIIIKRNYKTDEKISELKETPITWLFGILLWVEAILILYLVWMYPDAWLNSTNAYINTFIFVTLGSTLGGFSFLFSVVKKTIATQNMLISVSPFGVVKKLKWKSIRNIEKPSKNRLKFISSNDSIVVFGPKNAYTKFVIDIEPLIDNKLKNDIKKEI